MLYFLCLMCHRFCDVHNSRAAAVHVTFPPDCPWHCLTFTPDFYLLYVDLPYQEEVFDVWSFQAFCASENTKVLVVVATWRSSDSGMGHFGDLLCFSLPSWNLAHSTAPSLQLPLQGKSHRCKLKCISAGTENVSHPSWTRFSPVPHGLCAAVITKFLKDRSPGCSPREAGKQRYHGFSSAFAAVPRLSRGHELRGETGSEASYSHPASSRLANLPAGSQAAGDSVWLNFPAWKIF